MKRRKVYSGTFKAKAVCELLKGNKSLNELAKQFQVHPNQIKNWKSILLKNASYILEDKRKRIKDDDIDKMRNL